MAKITETPPPLWEISNDLDNLLLKLHAWNETFYFILEGMDREGNNAQKDAVHAAQFVSRFSAYDEMLFLILDGFQNCETSITALHERLVKEVG